MLDAYEIHSRQEPLTEDIQAGIEPVSHIPSIPHTLKHFESFPTLSEIIEQDRQRFFEMDEASNEQGLLRSRIRGMGLSEILARDTQGYLMKDVIRGKTD